MKTTVINRCMLILLFSLTIIIVQSRNTPHNSKYYWYERNRQLLLNRMKKIHLDQLPQVKNVIIFIGDGMGIISPLILVVMTVVVVIKFQIYRDHYNNRSAPIETSNHKEFQ